MGIAQAMLSTGLVHHEPYEGLKPQGMSTQALERQGFDQLLLMDDQQGRLRRRQVQRHVVASQGTAHLVALQIDAHAAVAAHQTHQVQAITDLEPAVRVDHIGHGGQLG